MCHMGKGLSSGFADRKKKSKFDQVSDCQHECVKFEGRHERHLAQSCREASGLIKETELASSK